MLRGALIVLSSLFIGLGLAPAAAASPGPVYKNCTEAHNAGAYNITQDDPAYWSDGDRDGDGYACEPKRQ